MSLSMFAFSHIPEKWQQNSDIFNSFFPDDLYWLSNVLLKFKKQTHNIFFSVEKKDSSKIITRVDIFSMYYIQLMEHNHIKGS